MNCDQYRAEYKKYSEDISSRSLASSEYDDWCDHLDLCTSCTEWYMQKVLKNRNVETSQYPCVHLAYHSTSNCDHDNAWECDVALVRTSECFGIPVRDGGHSLIRINNCPWCGIPASIGNTDG